jgi:MFS family permease
VADALPIYPLYALLFLRDGLSADQISLLFALWSLAGLVSGVPAGVLADRLSRRGCVVAAGPVKAAGFLCWLAFPDFAGFAAGFALWGLSGSLASGALEALVYDGLSSYRAEASYARVLGRLNAAELLGQLVAAALAAALFPYGGFAGVIWASAGLSLWSSVLAGRIPEPARGSRSVAPDHPPGIRMAFAAMRRDAWLRRLLVAVALLTAIDTLDEYFPLMAQSWGVPVQWTPLATVVIPLAGAAGAVAAGRLGRLRGRTIGGLLGCAGMLLGAAGLVRLPVGLVLVAAFYGLYRLVRVLAGSLLQQRIQPSSRATVSSVAAVGEEFCVYLMYAVWVLGGLLLSAVLVVVVASLLARLLSSPIADHLGYRERGDEEDR